MLRLAPIFLLLVHLMGVLAQECKLPSWTIKDVKIKSRDAVGSGGSASFTITSDATGTSEALSCASLQGNYRCKVASKAQEGVEVDLQINTGVAFVSVTQVGFACGSETALVGGRTEIELVCETTVIGGDYSCESEGSGTVQAVLL